MTAVGPGAAVGSTHGLSGWLSHRAAVLPDHPAVETREATLTYSELDTRASALAGELAAAGVCASDRVGLLAHNSLEFGVAIHGVARAGGVLVPLNARLTTGELAWQLANSRAALLLAHEPTIGQATAAASEAGMAAPMLLSRPDLTAGPAPEGASPEAAAGASDVAAIIYTSGTTGRPKGAMLTFANFWASAAGSAFNVGVLPGDRWLACLPLFHVGGLSILLRSVIYGTTAVIHPSFDEHAVNRALRKERITLLSVVPTMLERMLDADDAPFPASVRAVLVGGGPVTRETLERALARRLPVLQTYGLTEAASQVTTLSPADALTHTGSAGKPLLGTRIRIDAAGGEPGEILVCGETVTPGYFDNPGATAEALGDGWLRTGDIGRLDTDGFLYVLDRRDDLIVSGGENVYPAEVEGVLRGHPLVEAAAVVGVPDARWGQAVAAAVVGAPGLDPAELEAWLRARLAGFKVPRTVRVVATLPMTASGKVQRRLVREALAGGGPQ
ncbi:MAG: o-succinylbenzoate--CoA ligase [Chloroflexi bacterium]|nr:o-succinylbenzoate--CoA ligase [Chloroflexota bacterium]